MEATIRGFTQRDAVSPLTRHVLGLGILLLTVVPAYLVSQANLTSPDSEAAKMAREDTADTSVEITQIVEIEAHIREVAVRYDIPPILVAAIVEAESEFNPRAVSRRGAQGLMQLMPDTASSLRVSDSFDPYENIEGGVRHLRRLMDRYRGNLPLVLAAYNAGEQAVTVYRGVPPYRETRRYVSRILRRIGRPDLVPRYGHVSGLEHQAVVIPVASTHMEPAITFAVATSAPAPTPPRSAWAERQYLERQLHERQVVPPRVERTVSAPTAEPTASPWSARNLGEAP
jgi:transglycosylase-like protein with SLT domain